MAKRISREWVSEGFSKYITDMQEKLRRDDNVEVSRPDITAILAAIRPKIEIISEKKEKKLSILDF
jgi:hypothetical protein